MYSLVLIVFIANAMLLILHEIESAYENEWNILNIPGNISFFLILHIPIIILMFIGAIEIANNTYAGKVIGVILGFGGFIPFLVHKVLVNIKDAFNRTVSNALIYLNLLTGLVLLYLIIFQTNQ